MNPTNKWPPYAEKIVKDLWAQGHAASYIADKIAETGLPATRNSVIGKIHRMQLPVPEKKLSPRGAPRIIRVKEAAMTKKKVKVTRSTPANFRPDSILNYQPERPHIQFKLSAARIAEPDPACEVLLLDSQDGQCKAIVRYKDNDKAKAVYCGMPSPWTVTSDGLRVPSSWCNHHKLKYLRG